MTWMLVAYTPVLALFIRANSRRGALLTPLSLFAIFNAIGLIGTAQVVDASSRVDVKYAWIIFLGTLTTTVAATLFGILRVADSEPRMTQNRLAESATPVAFVALFAVSIGVTIAYYAAVGHVTLIQAITSNGGYDAASARLESYAGSQYFAPGYVNQFKNAVIPCLTFALVHRMWTRKTPGRLMATILLCAGAFVAVAGTGQRGPLIIAMLTTLVSLRAAQLLRGRVAALLLVGTFGLFAFTTYLTGRNAAELNAVSGIFGKIGFFANSLQSRVFVQQAVSGLAGFRYTDHLPIANGSDWLADILSPLPGFRGSKLASQIFFTLYGDDRGTSPPSAWGSVYYNFGAAFGILVIFVILACYWTLSKRLYYRPRAMVAAPPMNSVELFALAGMSVSIGAWIVGSPLTIMNQGAFAYALLYLLGSRRFHHVHAHENL